MPPVALLVIQGIQAAISEAPQAIALVHQGEQFIREMFHAGLITKEQQDELHAHIYAIHDQFRNGATPPEFQVELDPIDPAASAPSTSVETAPVPTTPTAAHETALVHVP